MFVPCQQSLLAIINYVVRLINQAGRQSDAETAILGAQNCLLFLWTRSLEDAQCGVILFPNARRQRALDSKQPYDLKGEQSTSAISLGEAKQSIGHTDN